MKNALLFYLLLLSISANSQSELWSRDVSKYTSMTQLENGMIFLKDRSKISAINHKNGDVIWEKRFPSKQEPQFLEDLPVVFFEGEPFAIIDASTGHIIDQSDEKTTVLDISYFWEEAKAVVQLTRQNILYILSIDLNDSTKSWIKDIGKVEKAQLGTTPRKITQESILTKDGTLLFVDKKFAAIIDSTGANAQRLNFKKKITFVAVNQTKNMLYLLEDDKKLHFIDVLNLKSNATFEFDNTNLLITILGDGSTIGVAQRNELRILDGVLGMQVGSQGFDRKINVVYNDEESGRSYVLTHKSLMEIDPQTGGIINTSIFKNAFYQLYKVYDKVILSGPSGISPVNLEKLTLEHVILSKIPRVHDYVEVGKYVCYTNQSRTDFSLHVVDQYGNVGWGDTFYSAVTPSLDVIGNGLLLVSGRKVRYLNVESGSSIWDQSVEVDPSFTFEIDEENDDLFMYSEKRLYHFDYSKGSLTRSNDKFKFDDFDYALQQPRMIVLPNAVFLKGSNTIFVVSKDGELIHKKTYQRINNGSTFWRIAGAIAAVATITSVNDNEMVNIYSDVMYESGYHADRIDYSRRIQQNRSSRQFPFVYSKIGKDKKGLIFLNPENGDERFFIALEDKEPKYIVDNVDGILFHLGKDSLQAFDIR